MMSTRGWGTRRKITQRDEVAMDVKVIQGGWRKKRIGHIEEGRKEGRIFGFP